MSTIDQESGSVEILHGLTVNENNIIITVTSTGCTDESNFKIEVVKTLPPLVTFIRVKPDLCKVAPHSVNLYFSLKEIGFADFKVKNLFAPELKHLK